MSDSSFFHDHNDLTAFGKVTAGGGGLVPRDVVVEPLFGRIGMIPKEEFESRS